MAGVSDVVVRAEGKVDALKGKETLFTSDEQVHYAKIASRVGVALGFISFLYEDAMKNLSWPAKILVGAITIVSIVALFILDTYVVGGPHPFRKWFDFAMQCQNLHAVGERDRIGRQDLEVPMSSGYFVRSLSGGGERKYPYFTVRTGFGGEGDPHPFYLTFFYDHHHKAIRFTMTDFQGRYKNPFATLGLSNNETLWNLHDASEGTPEFSEEVRGKTRLYAERGERDPMHAGLISEKQLDQFMEHIMNDQAERRVMYVEND